MKTTDNYPKQHVHNDPVSLLHSIQCLVMLVERHPNHPTSCLYLCLVSKALSILEAQFTSRVIDLNHQCSKAHLHRPRRNRKIKH
jgi:hypothetical protein